MTEQYNHRYAAQRRDNKWIILQDGSPIRWPDGHLVTYSRESYAASYALMWNYWGSMYDRDNPKCLERLPDIISHKMLQIALDESSTDEENEEHIYEQPTLWQ